MFTIPTALKNIRRHSRKAALYFLVCAVAALTLEIYMAGIDRTDKQLAQLPGAMPISGRVASLDGSRTGRLQIPEITADGLRDSEHVRDLRMTVLLTAGIGYFPPEDSKANVYLGISCVNTIEVADGLDVDSITWLPGYGPDFLSGGSEAACIVDSSLMKGRDWSLGDELPLNMYYIKYENYGKSYYDPLELADIRIVGMGDLMSITGRDMMSTNIIMPYETARDIFHRQGIAFYTTSATFDVRDAAYLNEFKAEMTKLNLRSVSTGGDVAFSVLANQGTALMLNDATFISAATRLQESLTLLRGFLPLLAAALAAIGYFVSYLMIQTRSEEYAVFRLLGLGKWGSMALYFAEIAALTLGGSLLGVLISTAAGIGGISVGIQVFALFSVCFSLGGIIALWRLGRTNVMLALTQN